MPHQAECDRRPRIAHTVKSQAVHIRIVTLPSDKKRLCLNESAQDYVQEILHALVDRMESAGRVSAALR